MLTAATYLGENTVEVLGALVEHLAEAGLDVEPARLDAGTSPQAAQEAGDIDVLWACGKLTLDLIASGGIDVEIVAAPVFAGQAAAVYHSVLVGRVGLGPAEVARIVAINEPESWSGHHGFARHLATSGRSLAAFEQVATGSHRGSVAAVQAGVADLAAIDHTIWHSLPAAEKAGLTIIERTEDWPAPPFSLARRVPVDRREHLLAALLTAQVPGLDAIRPATAADYALMQS